MIMRFSVLAVFRSIILVAVVAGLVVAGYAAYSRLPSVVEELVESKKEHQVPRGEEVVVTIPKGATLSEVGALLQEKGVISSALVFKLIAMIRGEQTKIKAGEYSLKSGSDADAVLDQLTSGRTMTFAVTVPEGYDMVQIADLFQRQGIANRERFLKAARDRQFLQELGVEGPTAEGYLFPDTYNLRSSEKGDARGMIRRMVKQFQQVYDKHVRATAQKYDWETNQVLTLASLIEKEARASEHALVSSVFHNRIRKHMPLQSDPTVIYGIKPMGSPITRADLKRDHPYNTYVRKDLPPGPICNPGKASLIAAIQPADTDYLYFVARNDGTHVFSSTLKEHNRAVNKYQRAPRKKELNVIEDLTGGRSTPR